MEIVIRATVVFLFLWLLLRALGKRELAEMSAFELVLIVVLGDVVQQGVTEEDMSVTGALLAAGTLGLWILAFSYLSFRSKRARQAVEGAPAVVIRNGRVYDEELIVERIAVDELRGAARLAGIDELGDVDSRGGRPVQLHPQGQGRARRGHVRAGTP